MDKSNIALLGIVVILVGVGIVSYNILSYRSDQDARTETAQTKNTDTKIDIYRTQSNDENMVTVSVTPLSLPERGDWEFEVSLQTHSVDLNFDVATVFVLESSNGSSIQASSWQGDPPGGHHRKGILKFKALSPQPETLHLTAQDIGNVSAREFRWKFIKI